MYACACVQETIVVDRLRVLNPRGEVTVVRTVHQGSAEINHDARSMEKERS